MFNLKTTKSGLRQGELKVKNKTIETPYYFPIATVGTVRTIAPWELRSLKFNGVLANTYHLYLRPGEKIIKKAGGLHQWMGWNGLILTDSGGFQVFSLGKSKKKKPLVSIKNDGVEFTSHIDGSKHFFTPEKVIQIQLDLGSDIIMPLDICPPGKIKKTEAEFSAEKTLEWLKIAKIYFDKNYKKHSYILENVGIKKLGRESKIKRKNKERKERNRPLLFGIIQGGTYLDLREKFAKETIKLDLDGYAIGGLAVGEDKNKMWSVVKLMDKILPQNKPRYLMGVGELKDFVKAVNLGIDLVDCVLPTRLARHGIIYKIKNSYLKGKREKAKIKIIKLDLRKKWAKNKLESIDKKCYCPACKNNLSISYLSHLIKEKEILGLRLLSLHNLVSVKRVVDNTRKI